MKQVILIVILATTVNLYSNGQSNSLLTTTSNAALIVLNENLNGKNIYASFRDTTTKDYNYYMRKRKNQKTIGWALLGGGFGLTGIGFLLANSSGNRDTENHTSGKAAVACLAVAAAAGLASIPFMIMAGNNKYKAKLLLETQKTGYGIPVNRGNEIKGISLAIPIGK